MTQSDFGRFLANVAERDVDLLLMEEFHVSDSFVSWFCARCGLANVEPAGAWHSVSDTDGETDLLLRVHSGNRRIGVLIEKKVAAPEQHLQGERYHLRGIRSREAGRFDSYVTVMCAPERYLDGMSPQAAYDFRIPYEEVAEWFSQFVDRRSQWRNRLMLEAIEQGRRGYTMQVSATNTAFQMAYWEHLQRHHPKISMRRPTPKGKKSNWIILKGHDFPKGVQLHHKFDQCVVELGFGRASVGDVLAVRHEWPDHIIPVQKGKTAALMIQVRSIDMERGLCAQVENVEHALTAVYELMPFAGLLGSRTG